MLGERFEDALVFAARLHQAQRRKGVDTPYVAHLLGVASLVIEFGGDEVQAIAALLHDSVEDQAEAFGGAEALRREIERRYGAEVLAIVNACTDADQQPKPDWWTRKRAYIAHLADTDPRALLVSCCDKLHNARAIGTDLRRTGAAVFDRFSAGREATLWYYTELARAFQAGLPNAVSAELARTVDEMQALAGGSRSG